MSLPEREISITETSHNPSLSFAELGLPESLVQNLAERGYTTPTPIQCAAIPVFLEGKDLIGKAQTGTGKTAAFALPIIANINRETQATQALILTPTRELALQVTESFKNYSLGQGHLRIASLYGGQSMSEQIRSLSRGVHIAVGTPGRLCDLVRRGKLDLSEIRFLVLDEADEMLKMGFIDDIEWLLSHTPAERQTALFSATMPRQIEEIANRHMRSGVRISLAPTKSEAVSIQQECWYVTRVNKLDALRRFLEVEETDASIVFVATKSQSIELAETLAADGFKVSPLNGDMSQDAREHTVRSLKDKRIDIVIATDVAARGIDVPRITHVFNYDAPRDVESYIHRIGRTGRAGRLGKAILFLSPRDRFLCSRLERRTQQPIVERQLPQMSDVARVREEALTRKIIDVAAKEQIDALTPYLERLTESSGLTSTQITAALCFLHQQTRPILLKESPNYEREHTQRDHNRSRPERGGRDDRDNFNRRGPRHDGPRHDGPRREGSRYEGPRHDGARREGPRSEGPRRDDFRRDAPQREVTRQLGSRPHGSDSRPGGLHQPSYQQPRGPRRDDRSGPRRDDRDSRGAPPSRRREDRPHR